MALSKPRVVVSLDFGTTFSGFAFAHITEPEKVYSHYDYPRGEGGEIPYCKTLTGIYYKKQYSRSGDFWQCKSWGFTSRAEYGRDIVAVRKHRASGRTDDPFPPILGSYVTRFKLHLASRDLGVSSAQPLPQGLSVDVLITDYLREMGDLIVKTLKNNYGPQLTKEVIQWCVTVPSIWDNAAKSMMKACMTTAGLVNCDGGSPHPLIMVLEPEAASFYCHKSMGEQIIRVGDKLLVADIGGGTSDIVVHEVVSVGRSCYKVKEVTTSSGDLCGGTYVDTRFIEFLHKKIGPSLQECINHQVSIYGQLLQEWERRKTSFGDRAMVGESIDINLPNKVVTEWEKYDRRMGKSPRYSYDDLEISYQEMQSIFDPVVKQNLELISKQLTQVGTVKVLVVVGGFAGSPYLMDCIRRRFSGIVPQIVSPPNPGSAVSQGAVMLALNPETIVSRVCKKTYGIEFSPYFEEGVDLPAYKENVDGVWKCNYRFQMYVRKGDMVPVNECISRTFTPLYRGQQAIKFQLFSSSEMNPRYTVGGTARKEGEIVIDISMDMRLDTQRQINVSLYFGGSSIEIKAEAVNFAAGGPTHVELPVDIGYL